MFQSYGQKVFRTLTHGDRTQPSVVDFIRKSPHLYFIVQQNSDNKNMFTVIYGKVIDSPAKPVPKPVDEPEVPEKKVIEQSPEKEVKYVESETTRRKSTSRRK